MTAFWEGVLGVEGELTGDGRLIEHNALRWEDSLPAPLRYVQEDVGAHDGAQVVGRILTIERRTGGLIWGTGDFDLGSEVGQEAYRAVREQVTNGVSMDLDDVSFELRVAAELMEPNEPAESEDADADGMVTVLEMSPDDEVLATTDGRIRAATIVAIPAFAQARIEVVDTDEGEGDEGAEDAASAADAEESSAATVVAEAEAIVASAAPVDPPAEWFEDPHLPGVTPLTVTEDGRVYGHLATWGTCHISHTAEGQCIQPPSSASGYRYFHVSTVQTAGGGQVAVGRLMVDTRHAGQRLNVVETLAHYEDTGAVAAFVRAGEDGHGIWVAGAVNPDASAKQVRALRSAPLSGDWRSVGGGGLELVGAISVNVPGFPIPRPSGLVASGQVVALVASGMVPPKRVARPGTEGALSAEDLRYLKALAQRERSSQMKSRADALASRVRSTLPSVQERAAALAARVRGEV